MTYISVMGTMGSGKTTAAQLLAADLGFTLLEENFGDNTFLPRFYKNMKRWAFHSQTFFLMEKVRQTMNTVKLLQTVHVVQDTPIEQDVFSYARALYEMGKMELAEWQLYRKIYESFCPYFPKPDLIVYLETPLKDLELRISRRGRGFEKKIPRNYLRLLDSLNREWLAGNKSIPVLTVRTETLNIATDASAQRRFVELVGKVCIHEP